MKVLFSSTIAPKVLFDSINRKSSYFFGGWLNASINTLIEYGIDFQLAIVSPISGLSHVHKVEKNGIVYYGVPQNNNFNLENNAIEYLTKQVLNDFCPDIIHINGLESAFSLEIGLANKKSCGAPVVASIQGLASVYVDYLHGYLFNSYYRKTISFYDVIRSCFGKSSTKSMLDRANYEVQLFSMLDGVIGRTHWDYSNAIVNNMNLKYFYCNEVLRDQFYTSKKWKYDVCEKNTVFCTNTSVPYKGFHLLLEAVSMLKKKYPDIKIKAIGTNVLTSDLKARMRFTKYQLYLRRFIKNHHLENNVEFLGSLSPDKMIENYLKSNVYVLPSVIENSPNSLCEAQLLGLPCVSSYVGGTSEFIEHGDTGFLYRAEESAELADYIDRVFACKHSLDLEKTSMVARERMSKHKHYASLNEIYREMSQSHSKL